jgi:hypothetical protein
MGVVLGMGYSSEVAALGDAQEPMSFLATSPNTHIEEFNKLPHFDAI